MCIDIIIREKSNGERGILDLMHKLSNEYGVEKPFNDNELFAKITSLTYPEVGEFLNKYVAGTTPIPYDFYLAKVGVTKATEKKAGNPFIKGQTPNITIDKATKEITVRPESESIVFFKNLNLKGGDKILAVNNKSYNLDNIYDLITESESWKENDAITVKVKRGTKEETIKGTVKLPFEESETFKATDASKEKLKNAWLKG
jgi:predicted metalloprotease with PDZ domain